jgi:amino acid adenylation domain-containing protein
MEGAEPYGASDRQALPDAAPVLELSTDRPRLTAREFRGETESMSLPAETVARLEELSARTGVPPTVVVLTVWAAVLNRHTGQRDLLLGVDAARFAEASNADAPAGTGIVPLRVELRPEAPFAAELRRFYDHVVDALRKPLVTRPSVPLRALTGPVSPQAVRRAAPDVALSMERDGADTVLSLHYNASLFIRTTAAWMLGHCAALLSEAVAKPEQPVRDLRVQDTPSAADAWPLPTPDGFTAPAPAERDETLVGRFRRTAAAQGDRIAVTGPSGTLTYRELDRSTSRTARRIRRAAGPGRVVGLLCAHDIGSVAGVWSVLKTGAAYVPLDPRQPDSRLTRLLLDADADAIVCDPDLADRAASLSRGIHVVPLDLSGPDTTADPSDAGDPGAGDPDPGDLDGGDPDALAYLLHTSGSSGRPKAVMQTQSNVLAHALVYATRIRIGPGDQVPLLARYNFDAAVMDLYGALLTGATLHVLDPLLPAAQLRDRLADAEASLVHCTPTLFRHLVGDLPPDAAQSVAALRSVRVVVLGGEEATQQDLRGFLAAFPATSHLVNGLGPTECTMAVQHLAGRADLGGTVLPVGHPVEGVQVRLVDPDGHPTELCGELEIRGERIASGYWNQPEVTAAAFRTDADGTRCYRTGDLARRRADGALVFRGRKDRQIKIRGHRVEPGEIEAVLRGHPTVAEAVLTVDTRQSGARLVAHVTPATAFLPDVDELRGYLGRILPEHAVPWRIVALERLPLGPTGKLDRSALPAPEEAVSRGAETPRTPTELAVAGIWCRVLGIASPELHGNFMASGGDSIRTLDLLVAVKDELGVEVPLTEFLAAPTIATLAHVIEREK